MGMAEQKRYRIVRVTHSRMLWCRAAWWTGSHVLREGQARADRFGQWVRVYVSCTKPLCEVCCDWLRRTARGLKRCGPCLCGVRLRDIAQTVRATLLGFWRWNLVSRCLVLSCCGFVLYERCSQWHPVCLGGVETLGYPRMLRVEYEGNPMGPSSSMPSHQVSPCVQIVHACCWADGRSLLFRFSPPPHAHWEAESVLLGSPRFPVVSLQPSDFAYAVSHCVASVSVFGQRRGWQGFLHLLGEVDRGSCGLWSVVCGLWSDMRSMVHGLWSVPRAVLWSFTDTGFASPGAISGIADAITRPCLIR
ncbi:hypothetical protein K431DRAFT_152717 [Polychaeton citri CBS 116435]|uniref:Uncharacterized protein n=1 Tax=Polychaeton citri CBS 116435 TaxID=1314669 RepID=A0A9P4Q3B3_9PEZI|nr:hypothetical protein K431DRAFT_152717 [Polychaeton citri CBS 116435]